MIIFWDFNGTILNDVNLCLKLLNDSLTIEHKNLVTKQEYLDAFDFPVRNYYAKVGFNFQETSFDILANRFNSGYLKNFSVNRLNNHVRTVLEEFQKRGYQQNILSATKLSDLKFQVDSLKITKYFKDIIGISDIYATSKLKEAELYLQKNKINPAECYMIGDTTHDALVARELGMKVLLYTKGHMSKNRLDNYPNFANFLDLLTILRD
ncbi:MAG: HAD family hydrolase [Acholeplasmatales bacterium]|jgi:phosphoglycolate phosphatase|nr:HAD family hydrolase [Acholeplasmatales bacterium]